ncbi:MAG: hypothetical protein WB543_17520, partial [Candidatus Acidiferrum sp.]
PHPTPGGENPAVFTSFLFPVQDSKPSPIDVPGESIALPIYSKDRFATRKYEHQHPGVSLDHFAVEVTNRLWMKAAFARFAQ